MKLQGRAASDGIRDPHGPESPPSRRARGSPAARKGSLTSDLQRPEPLEIKPDGQTPTCAALPQPPPQTAAGAAVLSDSKKGLIFPSSASCPGSNSPNTTISSKQRPGQPRRALHSTRPPRRQPRPESADLPGAKGAASVRESPRQPEEAMGHSATTLRPRAGRALGPTGTQTRTSVSAQGAPFC